MQPSLKFYKAVEGAVTNAPACLQWLGSITDFTIFTLNYNKLSDGLSLSDRLVFPELQTHVDEPKVHDSNHGYNSVDMTFDGKSFDRPSPILLAIASVVCTASKAADKTLSA